MKTSEYVEGLKALENFERMATAVFKVPKEKVAKTDRKKKRASSRKPKNADKD